MLDFRRITLFCLEKRVSRHKMTIFSKTLGKAMAALAPPGYVYASHAETCSLIKTLVHPTKKLFHCTQNRDDHGAGVTEWTPARVWSFGRSSIRNRSQGGFTQKPVMAYEPAYGQWQPSRSHMQQEHRNHQPRQSGLLKTQWRTQKIFMGGTSFSGIWWSFVFGVRCLWRQNLKSYSRLQTNVVAKLIDIICIFFYTHFAYFMYHCTEYKVSALQV